MTASVTLGRLLAIEEELGTSVDALDVTTHGDPESMYLIVSPVCAYCGCVNPRSACQKCGAPAKGVAYPASRL